MSREVEALNARLRVCGRDQQAVDEAYHLGRSHGYAQGVRDQQKIMAGMKAEMADLLAQASQQQQRIDEAERRINDVSGAIAEARRDLKALRR